MQSRRSGGRRPRRVERQRSQSRRRARAIFPGMTTAAGRNDFCCLDGRRWRAQYPSRRIIPGPQVGVRTTPGSGSMPRSTFTPSPLRHGPPGEKTRRAILSGSNTGQYGGFRRGDRGRVDPGQCCGHNQWRPGRLRHRPAPRLKSALYKAQLYLYIYKAI